MPTIDLKVTWHKSTIDPKVKSTQQKKRHHKPKWSTVINVEVEKLLKVGFIEEVPHVTWLINIVMVKKENGNWRMCVDFTNFKKVCLKDSYPLLNIDSLVDIALGYVILSFCDAFSRYDQILMWKKNKAKTTFITNKGVFYYKVIPFNLKNVKVTYQRMMNMVFKD